MSRDELLGALRELASQGLVIRSSTYQLAEQANLDQLGDIPPQQAAFLYYHLGQDPLRNSAQAAGLAGVWAMEGDS